MKRGRIYWVIEIERANGTEILPTLYFDREAAIQEALKLLKEGLIGARVYGVKATGKPQDILAK